MTEHGEQLELPFTFGPGTTPAAVADAIQTAAAAAAPSATARPAAADRWFAARAAELARARGETP